MNDLTMIILGFLSSSVLGTIFGYLLNKRNQDKKTKVDEVDSIVENTKKIREISSDLLDEVEKRWEKRFSEQEADHGEDMGKLRQRLEDEARQQKAELLVDVEDLKERNNDLKLQIAELGGYVNGITGDIYKPRKAFKEK